MGEAPTHRAKRILVADDEESMRKVLERRLLSWQFTVLIAKDGLEAMRLASEERPDLILLDVMIPGVDGLEVCRLLKGNAELARIPVVMVTAKDSKMVKEEAAAVGADGFVQKPYEFEELRRVIEGALKGGA